MKVLSAVVGVIGTVYGAHLAAAPAQARRAISPRAASR